MRTAIYVVRFAWDLTCAIVLGVRDDYRAAKHGLKSDLKTVTHGTPD